MEAARSGEAVEIASLTTETSQTFAEPDGSLTTVENVRPVRVRNEDGRWVDADATLRSLPDGGIAPVASALDVVVSGGGDEPMFTLEGLAGRELTVDWPGDLPEPQVSGAVATYPDVLPGVDLQVRAEVDNVAHLLVVKTPEAAADPALDELSLPVTAEGLDLRADGGGGLEAVDAGAGGIVFSAAQPMMWDSSGSSPAGARSAAADGPPDGALLAPVTAEVAADGGEVVLTPDQGLLEGPETTYPVYIDPQWWTERDTEWGMVSSYHPNSSFFKFSGDEGVGMCPYDYDSSCNYRDVKRLFYQLPTSRFVGKSIIDAEFVVSNEFSYNCTPQEVQLWRTRDVSAGTTWNKQLTSDYWIDRLQTRNEAHGWGSGCPAGDIEFWAGRAVADAAAAGWSSVTFGLRATNESEYTAWKRFDDTAFLRVHYNRPPGQPRLSGLTMSPGGACVTSGNAAWVNGLPRVYAEAHDPDGDDVTVQFRAGRRVGSGFQTVWTSATSGRKASGSTFTYALPDSLPANELLGWGVRVFDGASWSPWSYDGSATACYFRYDPTAPAGPAVTSVQYPPSDPENPQDPWLNGVGRYGRFTIDSSSGDVVAYRYGINTNPSTAATVATTGGAARTIDFMPTRVGVNFVTAQAVDAAGNTSSITTYRFRVRTGQPERAAFTLDERGGAATVTGTGGPYEASLVGGARPGGEGVAGAGLHLDGVDDHARTPGGVVDTTRSFSVALWARLPDDKEARSMVAVSQAGANRSAFELHHSTAYGGWVLYRQTNDEITGTQALRAAQPACPTGDTACEEARLGEWTHVVGTVSVATGTMTLYVDGQAVASAVSTDHWDSRASLLIGASAHRGAATNFFAGDIDDVRLYDHALSAADVAALHAGAPVTSGRLTKAAWALDEPSSAVVVTGRGEDAPATLHGGAALGAEGVSGTGLAFDGVDDHAVVPRPVVNTYLSFSVSLWALLPDDKPDVPMAAVTQESTGNAAFEIYHSTALGGWVFSRARTDDPAAGIIRAAQGACPPEDGTCPSSGVGEWTHVVAVYDHVARTMTLHINGEAVDTVPYTDNWTPNGPLYIGAALHGSALAGFYRGGLDEIRLYDRVVSGDEIQDLFRRNPVLEGRWRLDGASGTPPVTPEATGAGPGATLGGDATFGPGVIGDGQALSLDGSGDYAATTGAPFDSSDSWTVSAWVAAPARPQRQATVLSLAGTTDSALVLRYVPDADDPEYAGRWQLDVATADGSGTTHQIAEHDVFPTSAGWNHVAAVYDAFADQMLLYVNGELRQVVCEGAEDPECTDILSWRSSTWPFRAGGGLQIGRSRAAGAWGEYWSGAIDDVWAFRGVVPEDDIRRLAARERDADSDLP